MDARARVTTEVQVLQLNPDTKRLDLTPGARVWVEVGANSRNLLSDWEARCAGNDDVFIVSFATITSGGLFYDEFGAWATEVQHSDAPLAVVGFVSGVGILILGIVLVAYQPATGRTVVTPAASPGVASPGAGAGPLAAEEAAEETTDCFSCLTGTVAREPTRPSPPRTSASTTPNGKGSKSLW